MNDYKNEAAALQQELAALREHFHRYPEPGNEEFFTAQYIEEYLNDCGIATERMLDTAVVGTLYGKNPGRTAALRADMDALPVLEQSGAAFASQTPGMMHACGHDVHMAAVLGAAKMLAAHKDELCGTVKFIFQPDEEGNGGAARMVRLGAMDGVDAVFGAHVVPGLPLGGVGIRYGKFYAASDMFTISVYGKAAHGATPEKGIDALAAAAELALRLKNIPSRLPKERLVVTVGTFNAGQAENIVADKAVLSGIMRTLGAEVRSAVKKLLHEEANAIAVKSGTKIDVELRESYSGIVNDERITVLVEKTARKVLGDSRVHMIEYPVMTTEDFGAFAECAPGCYYHIGAGCDSPLHSPDFLPNSLSVTTAAAVHAAVIESFLNK